LQPQGSQLCSQPLRRWQHASASVVIADKTDRPTKHPSAFAKKLRRFMELPPSQ
jgi:hypothetical protein